VEEGVSVTVLRNIIHIEAGLKRYVETRDAG
jgi:hypothetical protein